MGIFGHHLAGVSRLPPADPYGNYYLGDEAPPGNRLPAIFRGGDSPALRRGRAASSVAIAVRYFAMRRDGSVVTCGGKVAYFPDPETALTALDAGGDL